MLGDLRVPDRTGIAVHALSHGSIDTVAVRHSRSKIVPQFLSNSRIRYKKPLVSTEVIGNSRQDHNVFLLASAARFSPRYIRLVALSQGGGGSSPLTPLM